MSDRPCQTRRMPFVAPRATTRGPARPAQAPSECSRTRTRQRSCRAPVRGRWTRRHTPCRRRCRSADPGVAVTFEIDRRGGRIEVVTADRRIRDQTHRFAAVAGVRDVERQRNRGRPVGNDNRRRVLVDHHRIEYFVDDDARRVARDRRLRNARRWRMSFARSCRCARLRAVPIAACRQRPRERTGRSQRRGRKSRNRTPENRRTSATRRRARRQSMSRSRSIFKPINTLASAAGKSVNGFCFAGLLT